MGKIFKREIAIRKNVFLKGMRITSQKIISSIVHIENKMTWELNPYFQYFVMIGVGPAGVLGG